MYLNLLKHLSPKCRRNCDPLTPAGTHRPETGSTLNLTHSQHFWLLKLDLMVWISLVPQWSRMEMNIFGYLNGNCSMVPLFKEDSQVSIISIPQFLPYRISFTLPPLEGTRWTLVQFERFCDLWTSRRNPLEVPVQLCCRATFPHINYCPNTFPTQNRDVQELFIQYIKEPASVEVTFSTILSNHKMPALTRKWTLTHVSKNTSEQHQIMTEGQLPHWPRLLEPRQESQGWGTTCWRNLQQRQETWFKNKDIIIDSLVY